MLVPPLPEEQEGKDIGGGGGPNRPEGDEPTHSQEPAQKATITLQPADHRKYFEPNQYLKEYYGTSNMIGGLKLPIAFLPSIAARLPHCATLLDVGSGPTVYVAMGFRDKVDKVYLSDYADQNRRELVKWCRGEADFDWGPTAEAIAKLEGNDTGPDGWRRIEETARKRVSAILYCNVHQTPVLPPPYSRRTFDIVTSIFCVEYASTTSEEYQLAMKNICALVKPGGWLFLGGAFQEHFYTLGTKRFSCYYLTEDELLQTLQTNGFDVDNTDDFQYFNSNDVFVAFGRKRTVN